MLKYQLLKKTEFSAYSETLKQFESHFTYPLGEQSFKLVHGAKNHSYFDFFSALGEPYYFVILDTLYNENVGSHEKIVGVGCAILREITQHNKTEKVWYLCDFKILPEYRKKGLLSGLVWRYFLKLYLKSNKFIAVNMSKKENNSLIQHAKHLLPFFKIQTDSLFFYEWNYAMYMQNKHTLKTLDCSLYSNQYSKDISINNKIVPIYHLVSNDSILDNLSASRVILEKDINPDTPAIFLYATTNVRTVMYLEEKGITPSTESCFIHYNTIITDISSAEI